MKRAVLILTIVTTLSYVGYCKSQFITFGEIPTKSYGESDFNPGATASSGLPITYTSSNTNIASIIDGKIHIVTTGTCIIHANQLGGWTYRNGNMYEYYDPAPIEVSQTLTIIKGNQVITFNESSTVEFTESFQPATVNSGLLITYTSSNTNVANGNDLISLGTSTFTATQPGDAHYNPAPPVSKTITIIKGHQSIRVPDFDCSPSSSYDYPSLIAVKIGSVYYNLPCVPRYCHCGSVHPVKYINFPYNFVSDYLGEATSGLPVSVTSSDLSIAKPNMNSIELINSGSCAIIFNQAGNENYYAAEPKYLGFGIFKDYTQSITFPSIPTIIGSVADFSPGATASSGLGVTYTSSNSEVATIVNGNIHIVGRGTSNICAIQTGNIYYYEATPVCQTLTVRAKQTISFDDLPTMENCLTGSVHGIKIDNLGNKWAIVQGNGVLKNDDSFWVKPSGQSIISFNTIEIDAQNNKWLGSSSGVVKYDGTNWTNYTTANGLASNFVLSIAIDTQGNKWFGTTGGVSKFDGTNWTNYTTANGLISNYVLSIVIDPQGNKWFGTTAGVSKFDGATWSSYPLNGGYVWSMAIDTEGNLWLGTESGVIKFDGANWITYSISDGLAHNVVRSIAIDSEGNKWFGTLGGVSKFDGVNWTTYNTTNSTLSNNVIYSIAIDEQGCKWFATDAGITKFWGSNISVLNKTYGDADFNPSAFASSGLPVTCVSDNPDVATILLNGKIHIVGAGSCTITATQEGNNVFASSTKSRTLIVNKANQTITFETIPTKHCGDNEELKATASSNLKITYTCSDEAFINNGYIFYRSIGSCTIYANQAGDANYNPVQVSQKVNVIKGNSIIVLNALSDISYGDSYGFGFAVSSNNTQMPFTFTSSNESIVEIIKVGDSSYGHAIGVGTCTIYADQAGNENWNPAQPVSQTLTVIPKSITVSADVNQKVYGESDPTLTYQYSPNLIIGDSFKGFLTRVSGDNAGPYAIQQGSLSAGDNYSITFHEADFAVTKKNLKVKAENKSKNYGETNPELTLSFDGFVNNEDKSVIDNLPTISCSATQNSVSGTYPIELSGGLDNNYDLALENGTLQINTILGTVNTIAYENLTTTGVKLNGEVTNHGGEENIVRGFVYGTTANPTLLNSKIEVGTGVGSFTQTISDLTPNTKYYVRSYATNSAGTVYGNELIFTTLSTGIPTQEASEVTIYPNPTTGIVYFKNIDPKAKIEIYNLNGALVKRVEMKNNQINIKDLTTGTYIIKIITDDKINTIKIVKE